MKYMTACNRNDFLEWLLADMNMHKRHTLIKWLRHMWEQMLTKEAKARATLLALHVNHPGERRRAVVVGGGCAQPRL